MSITGMCIIESSKVCPIALERRDKLGEPSNTPPMKEVKKMSRTKSRQRRKY